MCPDFTTLNRLRQRFSPTQPGEFAASQQIRPIIFGYNRGMKIALTHEQADFDAIASLLGAHLTKGAIPVLPHRMNRNVRSFVDQYSAELPYTTAKALAALPIESVLLVDTQSLITLKGMNKLTRITVIDHHAPRPNLDTAWETDLFELGACTTWFVEQIEQTGANLSPLQATLMLLGIYEDTGSLTYAGTSVRDVRAVAFLLEHGASLKMAHEFLYPPLSDDQRKLYDDLLANTRNLSINGLEVVISHAHAEEMRDEVSSTAHKLRDLLEPDALFLVISTQEGIRLVARSTTDQVDAAAVTGHFGGGGHRRAAAALIRRESKGEQVDRAALLDQVYQELTAVLPMFVQPAISVGEIMSTRPSLLSPTQSVKEAATLMQRFGFEGFPVVEDGRVVGLLTRRAVDRALAHKLERRVGSLMEAGEVTIRPEQTLDELQTLMTHTGWGQIPVVDPVDGHVIGIVTRTDLIRTLSGGAGASSRQNLADKLENALPPPLLALVKAVAAEAAAQGMPMYLVGGFVRDLLLERPSLDLDFVLEGNAIPLADTLAQRYGGKAISHRRFGTAKWQIGSCKAELAQALTHNGPLNPGDLPDTLDLISARTEFYDHPTALPIVERSSIQLDLHRRDFSINTLALRLDGAHYGDLYDYWGGLNDLKNGYIRVLHSISFVDDPTRLLRAVRFEQRFDFKIEQRTLQLMSEAHELMRQVSGDRIRHELNAILNEPKANAMLYRASELGLLKAISPYLRWDDQTNGMVNKIKSTQPEAFWGMPAGTGSYTLEQVLIYLAWFYCLPADHADAVARRLKLSGIIQKTIGEVHQAKDRLEQLRDRRPSQFVKILQGASPVSLYVLHHLSEDVVVRQAIRDYVISWQKVKPYADGSTLRRRQITSGPIYRDILQTLREAWLDGQIHTRDEEEQLLDTLISELPGQRG
jgi:tRNA nucleotidyltransferase (CCA-adding enzyme)